MYSDFDRMVAEFFNESGFFAEYVKTISSTPNDVTGGVTTVTETFSVEAIQMELIRPVEGSGSKTGTKIQDGDKILYVRPTEKSDKFADVLEVNPNQDRFIINGRTWSVVTVKEYNPTASNCILYEFYIRK